MSATCCTDHCASAQKHCVLSAVTQHRINANIEKKGLDREWLSAAYGLELQLQEWTQTKREKRGERQREERQGRESPECKAMYSRNVLPPVLSCNSTGRCPECCLTGQEGGREMDLMMRRGSTDCFSCFTIFSYISSTELCERMNQSFSSISDGWSRRNICISPSLHPQKHESPAVMDLV